MLTVFLLGCLVGCIWMSILSNLDDYYFVHKDDIDNLDNKEITMADGSKWIRKEEKCT